MLSKQMYSILSCMPRNHSFISYVALESKCGLTKDEMYECFAEVDEQHTPYFRRTFEGTWDKESFCISEIGLAEVEAYEQALENQRAVDESLKVAKIAMWAAIASAIVSIAAIIPQIISCIEELA